MSPVFKWSANPKDARREPGRRIRAMLVYCAVAAWVTAADPAGAVVGPTVDAAGVAPLVVMVLNRSGKAAGFCSGVVLARRAVMTAAHCVPAGGDVRIHFRDDAGNPVLLAVAEVVRHPGYRADAVRSRQKSIDLALIHLPEDLPTRFREAELGTMSGAGLGTPFRVAGYGVGQEGNSASSGQLRIGAIELQAPPSNLLLWARDPKGRGTGACEGDSGGAVLAGTGDSVVALTLWAAGTGPRRCGSLTQALWLGPHRTWIDGILHGWGVGG